MEAHPHGGSKVGVGGRVGDEEVEGAKLLHRGGHQLLAILLQQNMKKMIDTLCNDS